MKDALNAWGGGFTLDLEQTQLVQTIRGFAGAMSTIGDGVEAYAGVMQTLVHATTHVAIGFVPLVGPALDLCEAVTGKMYCLPGGKDLTAGERVFSAIGFGIGSVTKPMSGVKNSGVGAGAKDVAQRVLNLGEKVGKAVQKSGIENWKAGALKFDVTTRPLANQFEENVALHLMNDKGHKMLALGDDAVQRVVGIPTRSDTPGLSSACDFITVSADRLILSESKFVGPKSTVGVEKAVHQLDNVLGALRKEGLAGFVERVQIFKPAGANLKEGFKVAPDGKLLTDTGELVTLTGPPNLVVFIVEL
jgi:hypothetical protein